MMPNYKKGMILRCDFDGNVEPEMRGTRLVVVISDIERNNLATIIPLMKGPRNNPVPYIVELSHGYEDDHKIYYYARCDLLCSVRSGRLTDLNLSMDENDMDAITQGIKEVLNFFI